MAYVPDQSYSTGGPSLISRSAQYLTHADFPRQLIINDGDWEPCTDESILAGKDYLAVSYCQNDFLNKKRLEKMVRRICFEKSIGAYWIDFACTGESPSEKNLDLYRIADVFRKAKTTLIMIKGDSDEPMSDGWKSWGERIWTFPEALLSKTFLLQTGLAKLSLKEMSLNQVANHAYGRNDSERKLLSLYSHPGKDFSEIPERVEMLCEAIWRRHGGTDLSESQPSSMFTAYPGEKVYALMGFLLHRIVPDSTESEDVAFEHLLNANNLVFDCLPRVAYGENEEGKVGIKKPTTKG